MHYKYWQGSSSNSIAASIIVLTFCMGGCIPTNDASSSSGEQVLIETILENNLTAIRGEARTVEDSTTEKILKISEAA